MPTEYSDFKLVPAAKRDLEDIWRYTAREWSAGQADSYVTEITDAFISLVSGTKIGRSAEHIRKGYHSLLIGSHIAYFKIDGSTLIIIRILHQKMHVPNHIS